MASSIHCFVLCFTLTLSVLFGSVTCQIKIGSRLLARQNTVWLSENRTFAFGFTPLVDSDDQLQLGIWFHEIPGARALVWSANRDTPVSKNAVLEFDTTGNLILNDHDQSKTIWTSNTSNSGIKTASMSETGNFILYNNNLQPIWQTFSYPTDTLLPGQPLTQSMQLTSKKSKSNFGYYTMKMLQQPTSLSLALTYNLPAASYESPHNSYTNYSYWNGPDISNVTGDVTAVLDEAGSFGIVYGDSSDGAVYVYKNDRDDTGLSRATNEHFKPSVIRRLILEKNGNLRLYRWDNDTNGSRQWVSEWAAVSNPCDIAGICGNGICNLDKSKASSSCTCLPGTYRSEDDDDNQCVENSTLTGKCSGKHENLTTRFNISVVQQTNYYFSSNSVISNDSSVDNLTKCGDACLLECECVASVYGLSEEKPVCWLLKSLDFGGSQDPSSTLSVKALLLPNAEGDKDSSGGENEGSNHEKILVIPIALSMGLIIGLLCLLLYYNVHRRRSLRRAMESALILSGTPVNFSYRDLQIRTSNFSKWLGIGGFGSVYKGSLGDGTLIAVKKLERVLPHGEKEFITEVNTIGSMHHMNLVRLCGYCSEGQHRLLVYEFMKNGSLDKWIFSTNYSPPDKFLDWPTRYNIALGTAQGIAYFHEQCRDRIIHCDIKPENILLDENFCPKVSDFGLAKLMGRGHSQVMTMVRGTRGYLAPEWVSNRPITVKADVYSYGMVLLEIVSGRRNLDMSFDVEDFFFPGWAFKGLINGRVKQVVDKRLRGVFDEDVVMRVLKIAFWCIQDEVAIRPSMGEVVKMLEGSVEINMPMMPQTVVELMEEGLDNVYRAMRGEFCHNYSSFSVSSYDPSSHATCSNSSVSPR